AEAIVVRQRIVRGVVLAPRGIVASVDFAVVVVVAVHTRRGLVQSNLTIRARAVVDRVAGCDSVELSGQCPIGRDDPTQALAGTGHIEKVRQGAQVQGATNGKLVGGSTAEFDRQARIGVHRYVAGRGQRTNTIARSNLAAVADSAGYAARAAQRADAANAYSASAGVRSVDKE